MNDVTYAEQQPSVLPAARHQHAHWEMFYCTQGGAGFDMGSLTLSCCAGDVIIIPPDTPHAPVIQQETGCLLLHIENATLPFRDPAVIQDDDNQSLLHLFADTNYLFHSDAEYRQALLPAYGQLIIQHITSRRTASPRSMLVEGIARNIVQNYANPNYELDALLKSAPYCYDYLCRLFRQELNTTPHKYLANLRLQSAADALRAGNSSITEVARMCGYHDPLYFSRMFKKKFGVSPREYGRNLTGE